MHDSAIAGACAGLVSSILTCPLDVVKTKLQAQGGPEFQPGTPLSQGFKGSAGGISGGVGGGLNQLLYPASSGAVVGARGGASATGAHASQQGIGVGSIDWRSGHERLRREQRDRERVRERESRRRYARGLKATVRQIWEDDGVRGFYRGLGPTVFGYLPTWAIYFTVYDATKARLIRDPAAGAEVNFLPHILSAMAAGSASTICTSPLWVVKTRFMLQSVRDPTTRPYRHTGDAFVQIYRTEGLRGFYKGLLPSLFGVSHVAVQFPLYETFKKWARETQRTREGEDLTAGNILLCSSASKMIASVTTYPHEVLRTRLQMQPPIAAAAASRDSLEQGQYRASPQQAGGPAAPRKLHTLAASRRRRRGGTGVGWGSWWFGGVNQGQQQASFPQFSSSSSSGQPRPRHHYTGVTDTCAQIWREEGIRGFYKGMAVNLLRTLPSSALTILTYEMIMQELHRWDEG